MVLGGWTMYAMWAVLAVTILSLAAGILRALMNKGSIWDKGAAFLGNVLHYVLPLLVLAYLIPIDPTGIILIVVYFVAAICVIVKVLMDLT
jgi:hypothetical protein